MAACPVRSVSNPDRNFFNRSQMVQSVLNKHSVLIVSPRLTADSAFRSTLVQAGIFVHAGFSETDALRIAVQKAPPVIVLELTGHVGADDSLVSFADDYTRTHDAVIVLLSKKAAPVALSQGQRVGSIRWVDSNDCDDEYLAHVVVDAAGSLKEFDRECEARFGSQKTAGPSLELAVRNARSAHAKWAKEPDDKKADRISDLIAPVGALENAAETGDRAQMLQVVQAIQGLVEKVKMIPQRMNASISRTLGQAFDLLPLLTADVELGIKANGGQPSIMVLDDIAMIRRLHCGALDAVNLPSLSVDDPNRAIELFATAHFDLVFLDVHMPKMDGFQVCRALHSSPTNAATPAVFVTGLRDVETRTQSEQCGGIDFIAKPVLQHELGLKALIHLHRVRRKITA
jgi:CheY-like chemotaxis protein